MKASAFEYVRVSSVDEAVAQLAELGDEAKVLAGGQSLVPLLNLRLANPAYLVDINPIGELDFITNGSGVRVGAVARHRDVERSELVARANPLLVAALKRVGHAAIRNRGTIGGSVAHADPAAELPVTLGGTRRGDRGPQLQRGPHDCGSGFLRELLDHDSSTRRAADRGEVSQPAGRVGWSIQEFSRRSGDFGVVTVAVTLAAEATARSARPAVAFGGVAGTAVRALSAEAALAGQTPSAELWKAAGQEAAAGLDPPGDLHSTPEHRRHLAAVLTERALIEAYGRLGQEA